MFCVPINFQTDMTLGKRNKRGSKCYSGIHFQANTIQRNRTRLHHEKYKIPKLI